MSASSSVATIPQPFPKRKLGSSGQLVSAIGLGCMGMSEFYGSINDQENIAVLNEAIDKGCTFLDTADMYGIDGANEKLLSQVLKTRRNEVFLATKFGNVRNEKGEFLGVKGTPEYVRASCEASLKRLGVDYIDLYYQHRVDKDVPIEETVKAMAELVREGKVRYLGLSECSAETLRRACKVHPIAAVQIEYSPWSTDIERNGLLEACRENNVAIVAYSPLGRGFLTGRFKSPDDFEEGDFRRYNPRFQGDNFKKNYELVEKLTELATKKGVTPSQLTLAWVLAQGDDFIPIPGTKKSKYLNENLAAASIKLTDEELKEIRAIIDSIEIQGTRYPEQMMHTLDV
eukprot:GEZU01029637.1.p1 GENE.GEZU01029637.1~~GEZU01029637.1.p1  ORF type:complete len:344 (-),score=114.91 GEZU01029637.1:85-1116(-)